MSAYGKKKTRVVAEIEKNPIRTHREIAEAAGCSLQYVKLVSKDIDFPVMCAEVRNQRWVREQAAALRVTQKEFIQSLVTDARLEDEEKANDPT